MTSRQYAAIEKLLAEADEVTMEHPLITREGVLIQAHIREVLKRVVVEKIRAETRERETKRETSP